MVEADWAENIFELWNENEGRLSSHELDESRIKAQDGRKKLIYR